MRLKLKNNGHLSTGNPLFDEALNEGFQYNTISHFYGSSGTGKTTLAMQLSLQAINKGYETIWYDLNYSFSLRRFIQMNGGKKNVIHYFRLLQPESNENQAEIFKNLENYIGNATKLIVIDPFTYIYRLFKGYNSQFGLHRELFHIQLPKLARIVLSNDLHIILVNQVRGNSDNDLVAVGGEEINKFCKYVLWFENDELENSIRHITIEKLFQNTEIKLNCKLDEYGFTGFEKC